MPFRRAPLLFLAMLLTFGAVGTDRETRAQSSESRFSILVFSKTEGYRHASISAGKRALLQLGQENNFRVDTTASAEVFTRDQLAKYDAVVFLNTTGDVFDEAQQRAFEQYIQAGHGFIGIHAAADTEYEWSWYRELVGAYFKGHPRVQSGTVHVSDPVHPATRGLPTTWSRTDEWYNYRTNPRGEVHVLATLDEQSYEGGTMGADHPIAWVHEHDGGRAFYTGGGHTSGSFTDPKFRTHLLGGIEWAAGRAEGDAAATVNSSYEKVVLDSTTTDPMDLDVAPDGRVFYIERRGTIRIWHPETKKRSLAGYLPVSTNFEDGLIGMALDPNFAETHWIYLYYSPVGPPARNQLSRFPVEDGGVRLDRETKILTVPTQREACCHTGGSVAFGPDGDTLYLSTGDDTNPFASSGFSPIDERPDRKYWDAQRTAANTQDLRGKILRIVPQRDGSYTIPEGNLFEDPERGRPEIYVMGCRNPYRISVDKETGWLYWGEIGPDSGAPDSTRGPAGHDEFNQAREPGYYGWPYFVGNNIPYHDYDFAADTAGAEFDPESPVNDSPNNTGARNLPPAQPAMIWYPYGPSDAFSEMGAGGRSAMAGPVYHHDNSASGPHGLPAYFDGSLLIYEWARNWIKEVTFDSTGHPAAINPLFTDKSFIRPMDVEVGPQGRLYVLQWGNAFRGGPNSQIVRLDYHGRPQRPPSAVARTSSSSGPVPLTITLSAEVTHIDSTARPATYEWDVDGDGAADHRGARVSHTFETPGRRTVHLTVTDANGRSTTDEVTVVAGNTRPTVRIGWPLEGGVVPLDEPIPYRVSASDAEDDSISQGRLVVQSYLGRDSHALPLREQTGAMGTFRIKRTGHYTPKEDLFAALGARYTDGGASGVGSTTSRSKIRLQPRRKEAEYTTAVKGAGQKTVQENGSETERTVLTVEDGHHAAYAPVNFRNVDSLTFRLAAMAGGRIEVRRGAPDGPVLGEAALEPAPVDSAGADTVAVADRDYQDVGKAASDWKNVTVGVSDPGGAFKLYLVFHGLESVPLLRLDWFRFEGPGMTRLPSFRGEEERRSGS